MAEERGKEEVKEVVVRYFDLSDLGVDLLFATDEEKLQVLGRLGVVPTEGERPLAAWVRAMSEENDVEFTVPAHPLIAQAVLENKSARDFMWFLA